MDARCKVQGVGTGVILHVPIISHEQNKTGTSYVLSNKDSTKKETISHYHMTF